MMCLAPLIEMEDSVGKSGEGEAWTNGAVSLSLMFVSDFSFQAVS